MLNLNFKQNQIYEVKTKLKSYINDLFKIIPLTIATSYGNTMKIN